MNGVLDRVNEFQIFRGGKRDLAWGYSVGCRHGGCWRAVAIGLEKINREERSDNRAFEGCAKDETESGVREKDMGIKDGGRKRKMEIWYDHLKRGGGVYLNNTKGV